MVIGIRYLTGYAAAADAAAGRPEWPPHPGRVFMSLAAAHFESGADAGERQALEWLESLPAPSIQASPASDRSFFETYVPANDQRSHEAIEFRSRQPRSFAKTRPDDDTVFLIWQVEPTPQARTVLEALCAKVTRIGHSSSLVQMWLAGSDPPPQATWHPGGGLNGKRLRIPSAGTLRYLGDCFGDEGAMPQRSKLNTWQEYSQRVPQSAGEEAIPGPFDPDFIVLTLDEGNSLGLESTLQLTSALRNAAMKAAGADPPEWLTGHTEAGSPSQSPHAAFFPLPFVGHRHADGHIMGLGIALPHNLTGSQDGLRELRTRLGPLFYQPGTGEPRQVRLWRDAPQGRVWEWTLSREIREAPPLTLRRTTWMAPSRVWASVTPVVLHHYPKRREGHLERIIRDAFLSALLPAPESFEVLSVSAVPGAGHARSLPGFDAGGEGLCRYRTHVVARFANPVRGPILVGRGRYRGYGLFAPLRERESTPALGRQRSMRIESAEGRPGGISHEDAETV